jgi:nitrogen fixation protein NifB
MTMKIAIASSDGVNIDQHFGHAEYFYIYEIDDNGGITEEERRGFSSEIVGHDRVQAAIELLSDVHYVLCAQIGPRAVETLASSHITGYALAGSVQKALQNYVKRRGLLKNLAACPTIPSCGSGCRGCGGGEVC